MNRFIRSLLVLAALAVAPTTALAQEAPPTPAQIEKAKKAFQEGKKLHAAGKHAEAVEKFKLSYQLSKNPLLLYNVAVTFDEMGMEDLALLNYRKFLADAPQEADQRPTATERVKVLEQKLGLGTETKTEPTKTEPTKPVDSGPKKPVQIKPPGTYSATDFQHEVVDVAPPAKPLDVTAFVPEDSGFTVTLYFRTTGEGQFASKEMRWRYKELVARIPAPKMIGNSVQYYVEVKDSAGAVVTRSGKSTSPHLVTLEKGAPQRFYPDFTEDGEAKTTVQDIQQRDIEEDDPLNRNKKKTVARTDDDDVVMQPQDDGKPGTGFRDVGSSKFTYMKWGSTATAATGIGLGLFFFIQAGKYADQLESDVHGEGGCGSPPCKAFDSTAAGWESTGKSYNTYATVGFVVGGAAALVAGYYWYKELTAKKRGELKVSKAGASPETSWVVVPSLTGGETSFVGGSAVTRF